MILAALAADAAPGKNFTNYRLETATSDLEQLALWDSEGFGYILKSPRTPAGERELALELEGLRAISAAHNLPFEVPRLLGQTRDLEGSKAVLLTLVAGNKPDLSRYTPGKFSQSIAQVLAAIHQIDTSLVRDAGLVEYQNNELVFQRVAEVDRIASTGRVAPQLLTRWEQALEDVALFRFHPVVIHGGINEDSLAVNEQEIAGVSNWNNLCISDPAEDFRWLAGGALLSTFDDAMLHYRATLPSADENLALRATLYSELELGSWLVHCLENEDQAEITRAEDLLTELRDQLDTGSLRELRATSFAGISQTQVLPRASEDIPEKAPTKDEELF